MAHPIGQGVREFLWVVLDVLDEKGQLPEAELRAVVSHASGWDDWTAFTLAIEELIARGHIGVVVLRPATEPVYYKRVRTRPVRVIPVEVD